MEPFFMFLRKSLDFCTHNFRCFLRTRVCRQCSWVLYSGIVVWCLHYLVLCNPTVGYCMSKWVLVFVCKVAVCCEGTARSSFLTASAFFCIWALVPLVSSWHGLNGDDCAHIIHVGVMGVHINYLWYRTFISACSIFFCDKVESNLVSRNTEANAYVIAFKLIALCRNW